MEVFKPVVGDEAKIALAQFLGQNIGELRKLDTSIVSKNKTLEGLTIDLNKIGSEIPAAPRQPEFSQQQPNYTQPIPTHNQQPQSQPQSQPQVEQKNFNIQKGSDTITVKSNEPQLEFNFQLSPNQLFDKLDNIEKISKQNNKLLKDIFSILQTKEPDIKKKS